MTQLRTQLAFLLVLLFEPSSISALGFNFHNLLYSMRFCTHESTWCPKPRCYGPGHHPSICEFYRCQDSDEGGPMGRECVFVGNCNGDQSCIDNAMYLGADTDAAYYDEDSSSGSSSSNYDNTNYSTDVGDGSALQGQTTVMSSNWMAYAVMGAVLAGVLVLVVFRKRSILNDDLGEELEPKGLSGAVARHHSHVSTHGVQGQEVSRTKFVSLNEDAMV
eukprot:Nitzschia sp. Nitz4//scaffold226_size53432//3146//3974//NITZ4_006689-RA/size53432-augustus-gene-0.52-mRNA-1//1//CDS//3329542715//4350//frame0